MNARLPVSRPASGAAKGCPAKQPTRPRLCIAQVLAAPMQTMMQRPRVVQQPWDEVEALQQQLRDAEAERDRFEALMLESEAGEKRLMNKLRQMAMSQASTKLALGELKGMVGDAKMASTNEHREMFADRIHVCGQTFKNEACAQAFVARQEEGMQRLSFYSTALTSLTGSLISALETTSSKA